MFVSLFVFIHFQKYILFCTKKQEAAVDQLLGVFLCDRLLSAASL